MKVFIYSVLLVYSFIFNNLYGQPRKEVITLSNSTISNLALSYDQIIKKTKADTSYLVTIELTDVHPITSKRLAFGGNKRSFYFFTDKTIRALS